MNEWQPTRLKCPQCGRAVLGYKNTRGDYKLSCDHCGSVAFSRRKTPSKRIITVIAAQN